MIIVSLSFASILNFNFCVINSGKRYFVKKQWSLTTICLKKLWSYITYTVKLITHLEFCFLKMCIIKKLQSDWPADDNDPTLYGSSETNYAAASGWLAFNHEHKLGISIISFFNSFCRAGFFLLTELLLYCSLIKTTITLWMRKFS